MLRRRSLTLLSFAALVAGSVLMFASATTADVTGPCTATMNGADVNTIDTPGTALEVPFDGSVSIQVTSSGAITGHVVKLEPIGGLAFTADEGADQGNGWAGTVEVADYATYGVGLYKVIGDATGPGVCSGVAFVKVTGKNPLTTVAGAAGAGLAAAGAVGVVASAISAGRKARYDSALMLSMAEQGEGGLGGDVHRFTSNPGAAFSGGWLLGLTLTLGYMVAGAGGPGAPGVRSIPFRPRVAVGASIWGLMFGLGTLVLTQQFALLYPTLVIAVVWLVIGGLLGGVLVPSLVRLSAVRAVNARLSQIAAARAVEPVAVAPTAEAAPAWAPTHRAPADGLDAWPAPDPASAEPTRLGPGLQLALVQVVGDWAQVVASNGWTGWVDGRRLEPLG